MVIQYFKKKVYGRTRIYLVDTSLAKDWRKLVKHKTLYDRDIAMLEKLGVSLEEVQEEK